MLYMAYAAAAAGGDIFAMRWLHKKNQDPDYESSVSEFCNTVKFDDIPSSGDQDNRISKVVGFIHEPKDFEESIESHAKYLYETLPLVEVEYLDGGVFVVIV